MVKKEKPPDWEAFLLIVWVVRKGLVAFFAAAFFAAAAAGFGITLRIVVIFFAVFADVRLAIILNCFFCTAAGDENSTRGDGGHGDYFGQVLLQHILLIFRQVMVR